MTIDRRKFLSTAATGAAAGAALPALMGPMMAFAAQQQQQSPTPTIDEDVMKFWTQQVRRDTLQRGGPEEPQDETLLPEFLIYTDEHGFRSISEVPDTELAAEGDVLAATGQVARHREGVLPFGKNCFLEVLDFF